MKITSNIILICILSLRSVLTQTISFHSLNGPNGGNIGDIVVSSHGDIYVTVYYSYNSNGVYKSIDNGISWIKLPSNSFSWWIDYFGLGINSNDHLFLGTNGAGLYRSTDNGLNWTAINNGFTSSEGWVFAFDDTANIYAGDGDHWGLFKSTNNGDSWQFLKRWGTLSLAIDSRNTVYAGTWDSLYKSTDYGLTWDVLNNGLPRAPFSSILIKNNNELFLGTGYIFLGNGVFYSSNGGESWIQRGLQNKVVYSLAMHSSGIIYAGTMDDGVFRSSDNGQNWEPLNSLINKNIYRLKMTQNDLLFAASETDGGIFRSTDLGNSWRNVGLPIGTVENALIPSDNNLYVSTYGGMQKYNYSYRNWTNLGPPLLHSIISDNENTIYAGTYRNGVFKSTNFGISWDSTASYGGPEYVLLCMAKNSDGSILVGTNDYIKRTTNKGLSWQTISNGLEYWVANISISPDGIIYASSSNKLYKSESIDSVFTLIADSIQADYNNNVITSSVGGCVYYVREGNNGGVFRSTNYGENWLKISDSSAYSISSLNDYICVGLSNFGILFSSNQGDDWEFVESGLSQSEKVNYSFFDSLGYLYCSILSDGLYKSNSAVTKVSEPVSIQKIDWRLSQNYPNPFNPITKISWQSPVSSWQTLKVYDVLGNEVAILVDEYKLAGSYEIEFDASSNIRNLASGIYFYQLKVYPTIGGTGDYVATKKMLLLR